MEDKEAMLNMLLSLWAFHRLRIKKESQKRLRTARRNTLEKYRRVWEAIERYQIEDEKIRARRRAMMAALIQQNRSRPSVWALNRASKWWDDVVPGFTNSQWVQNFRMSEQTFNYLCNKLRPALERQDTTFRQCVPLRKRVAMALWKLATGSAYKSIGNLFGVSITTVCRCVQEFCAAAETLLVPEQIRFPDEERFRELAAYIENTWGLPHCVGAVDGSHIPIIAPQHSHSDYINPKGWHSIVLQGVVDGKGLFWNVFAGSPGSMHDAGVLKLSTLWELASRGNLFPAHIRDISTVTTGYYILGNTSYPSQDWLLKPFHDSGRLTPEQHAFNRKFYGARVVVENAFGRLKGRWRCLLKKSDCDVQLVKSMVLTCCALHNLCETHEETYETSWDEPAADEAPLQSVVTVSQDEEGESNELRDALMQYFLRSRETNT